MLSRDYLGVGVTSPEQVDNYGQQALVADVALVRQSLARIFATAVGSDFMNRAFGSRLHLVLFDQNSRIMQSLLEYFISEAIDLWETRIRYDDTTFEVVDAAQLNCTVHFTLRAGGQPDSFVFPFYREQAS